MQLIIISRNSVGLAHPTTRNSWIFILWALTKWERNLKKKKLTHDSHKYLMLYMTIIYSDINNIKPNNLHGLKKKLKITIL